jgi:hypothetical protein
MKKIIFLLVLYIQNIWVFGVEYNINDFFQINLPNEFEVASITQKLRVKSDKSQYCITNNIYFIFENKYFVMTINCYGNNNIRILDGSETYNMETGLYYSNNYSMADEIKYLMPNYIDIPLFNKNNVKYSKFISDWPSGRTSDYYGLYFQIPNNEFSECIISIYNIWGSFATSQRLKFGNNPDYKEKYMKEGGKLQSIFQLLELFENSITFSISKNILKIANGYSYEKYKSDYSFILPTINNLEMRKEPSLNSEVLGYMSNRIYQIIIMGNESEIDGIKGNWILIKPPIGNNLRWVFSGYTRKATEEEINKYFEGS